MFHGRQGINSVKIILSVFLFLSVSFVYGAGSLVNGGFYNSTTTSQNWWRNGANLDLDFANDRYYLNGTTYSGISNFVTGAGATFSRGSTATYYNSSGVLSTAASNVPRLDYDPLTLAPKGILIEESSTNSLLYSSAFSTAPWMKTSAITLTPNATTAPDGTNTAFLISADGSMGSYISQTGLSPVASQTVTRSMFVKAGTTSKIYLEFNDGTYKNAAFDLAAKTVTFAAGTASLIQLQNGWFRIVVTYTYSASGLASYTTYIGAYGNGVGNMYIWGAQLEYKAFPTSYIPTTSSTITRSADIFSIPTAAWYNATAGTFLSWGYAQKNSNQPFYGRLVGGDSTKCFGGFNGSFSNTSVWNGISAITRSASITASSAIPIKVGFSWDQVAATESLAVSSAAINSNSSYTGDWTTTNIYPGGSNYNPLNTSLLRMTFFPVRMPDAYLKDMTR